MVTTPGWSLRRLYALDDTHIGMLTDVLLDCVEGETLDLGPRQGFVVPKGVMHRPRAPERTIILMVEPATIVPTGSQEP